MFSDVHAEDECTRYETGECDICRFIDKYDTILENDENYSRLVDMGNELILTYKKFLSEERIDVMYSKLEKQIQMERLRTV